MSTQRTKEELVRLAWTTKLRRQGHRQCVLRAHDHRGNVCAFALLAEIAPHATRWPGSGSIDYETLARAAGLARGHLREVLCMNDGKYEFRRHTFAEIADVVEGWFHAPQ